MANKTKCVDFKQDANGIYFDPILGDFVMVESDSQHVLDILIASPGWWKNAPQIGASARQMLKAKINVSFVENVITTNLEADGFQVGRPDIKIDSNGKFIIKPNAFRL